jgi:Fe-S-cluster containining protein
VTERSLPPLVCNGCTECCHGPVMLHPSLGDDYRRYRTEDVYDGAGNVVGKKLLQKLDGSCHYLGEKGCVIWGQHPAVCKAFDCRKYARLMR